MDLINFILWPSDLIAISLKVHNHDAALLDFHGGIAHSLLQKQG